VLDEHGHFLHRATSMLEMAKELRKNMTPAEKMLWRFLRGRQLCGLKFYRQVPIDRFIVDFYCSSKNLIIEVDGSVHDNEEQRSWDGEREIFLQRKRLRILRFRNNQVLREIDMVLKSIANSCGKNYVSPLSAPAVTDGRRQFHPFKESI